MNKSSLENKSLRLWQFLINLSASGGLVPCCWGKGGGGSILFLTGRCTPYVKGFSLVRIILFSFSGIVMPEDRRESTPYSRPNGDRKRRMLSERQNGPNTAPPSWLIRITASTLPICSFGPALFFLSSGSDVFSYPITELP